MHFKLYEGYVKETNILIERIAEFLKDGKVDQEEMPAYSELKTPSRFRVQRYGVA
jgi:Fe-Mn family superoxide dismutase